MNQDDSIELPPGKFRSDPETGGTHFVSADADPATYDPTRLGFSKLSAVKPIRPPTEQNPIGTDQMEKDAPAAAIELRGQLVSLAAANSSLMDKVARYETYTANLVKAQKDREMEFTATIHEWKKQRRIIAFTALFIIGWLVLIICHARGIV